MSTETSPVSRPVRRLAPESGAAPLISRLNPSVPILPPRVLSDEAQLDVAAQTDEAQPVEGESQPVAPLAKHGPILPQAWVL